ncbi:LOW QUALITY PROTEIN: uncharacterized protein LOC111082112 [Drosophila obscura]|uniref:LOW QUALITY PROTEIN: uncharacterized protein LOC111082112 n=1 Tax=Drosophila obscura TaxID=7282 RepID=UPI001BB1DE99|nr:LOW QUALITY PROTEIN: uncharacterized protein LOC111082112 [Drosophila obscura]
MLAHFSPSISLELFELYGRVLQFLVAGETTVFYYNPSGLNCSWHWLWQRNLTTNPQIVWQRDEPAVDLIKQFNSNLFVLACLSMEFNEWELLGLASSLSHLRGVRVLIEVAGTGSPSEELLASKILSNCLKNSMLNAMLYFQQWSRLLVIYSFRAFPHFDLIKQKILPQGPTGLQMFVDQLADIRGLEIVAIPDLSPPNSFQYTDVNGQKRVAGYLWTFIAEFASSLGGRLKASYPTWSSGRTPASRYMQELTRNASVDFGLTTTMVTEKELKSIYQYSYPILYSSWCTMLPMERPIPVFSLFHRILSYEAVILVLTASLVLGLLVPGLLKYLDINFRWRLLHLTPRLLALVLVCACAAQLLSLLISRPTSTRIDSFDDLLRSGLRIFGMRSEFYFLEGDFRAKYAAAFHLTNDPTELYDNRNYFNTSWAYTITTVKWAVIDAQQRHFTRPVFRLSRDMCFNGFMPSCLLIPPESVYRDRLQHFTLRMDQSGLIAYWIRMSFYDMVKAGRMTIKDYSQTQQLPALNLNDIQLAWHLSLLGVIISLVVFGLELLRFYTPVFLNSL